MTRLVAIGSGKGGVGKTWLAIALSQALARLGERTLLVDADVGLANIDIQLGLDKGPNLGLVLSQSLPITTLIRTLPELEIDVVTGRSGTHGTSGTLDLGAAECLMSALRPCQEAYDLVVLDLPSGMGHGMRRLLMRADDAIFVTTEEPTALSDAYALMKAVVRRKVGLLPKLIINQVESHHAGKLTFDGLARVCERFLALELDYLGAIRRDRRVLEAIGRQGALLQCFPNCDAAQDVADVALRLARRGRRP